MIVEAIEALRARLTAAGLRAVVDERNLNPPAVWIRPPTLTYTFGGGADVAWQLIAVVPDTGASTALAALDELVEQIRAALDGEITTAAATAVAGSDSGSPLPAYRLTYTSDV
jgi:hypothetical protein